MKDATFIGVDLAKPGSDETVHWKKEEGKIKILPGEGIYFGMSFDDYKALPYFSRSFSEDILFDLQEGRFRIDNPMKTTAAMDLGTAIHSMILEEDDFKKSYICRPNPANPEFEGKKILFTIDDLKPHLEVFGFKKSGKKEEMIASLLGFLDPAKFVIWDEVIARFEVEAKDSGKKILEAEAFKTLVGLRQQLNEDPEIKEIFEGGYAEVTLIWKDKVTGILCKCRLDYLRADLIGEVKSFSVKGKKVPLMRAIHREIENFRYNLQFSIYLDALEDLIEKINAGKAKVFGEVDADWLKEFLASTEKRSFIMFARTQAPYQIKAKEIQRLSGGVGSMNDYFKMGNNLWRAALQKYAQALKSGVWKEPSISVLQDFDVQGVRFQENDL